MSTEEYVDFVVDVEEGREIRVLQLTDPQIIDSSQQRYEGRLSASETSRWASDQMEERVFKYIRDAVERSDPDLILMTGDLVYGQFDDAGTSFTAFVEHMESYRIPWAPVYGNHDNESAKGAIWQNQKLLEAEHCLFKKGETDGNGNYTVGVKQGGEIVRVFYMLDSNSCTAAYEAATNGVIASHGFTENQLVWLYDAMSDITEANGGTPVPSSACWHVPTNDLVRANNKYYERASSFTINKEQKGDTGDFGALKESNGIKGPFEAKTVDGKIFLDQLKKYGVDSVFVGHSHQVNTSITYEGIRWTFGLKTGEYDRYTAGEMGGTLIMIVNDSVSVKHLYYDRVVQEMMENLVWKEPVVINGLGKSNGISHDSALSFVGVEYLGEKAYEVTASSQGKVYVKADLLAGKSTFTFSVYVPSGMPKLGGLGTFAIRVKPDDGTAAGITGSKVVSGKYYIDFDVDSIGTAKLMENTWQTFTVDISCLGNACKEFSFVVAKGSTIYLKDITIA